MENTENTGFPSGTLTGPTGLINRVFASGLEDQGSISGRVIPKTQKMVLDSAMISTHHYKLRIKGKMEQSIEWRSVVAIGKIPFWSPSTIVANFLIKLKK